MASKTDSNSKTSVEYEVWYNAADGNRRHQNALDEENVQRIIESVHSDEDRRHLLAESVGLTVDSIEPEFQILKVTTTVEVVEYE